MRERPRSESACELACAPITAILLAAGAGRRFGAVKQLAQLGGRPLVAHAVGALMASSVTEIVVVVGAAGAEVSEAVAEAALADPARPAAGCVLRFVNAPDACSACRPQVDITLSATAEAPVRDRGLRPAASPPSRRRAAAVKHGRMPGR